MKTAEIITFTGGDLGTNSYLLPGSDGSYLCLDAPPELDAFLKAKKLKVSALLLTHGHFDHVWDAARVQEACGCPVYAHPVDFQMIQDPSYLIRFGITETYPILKEIKPLDVPFRGSMKWSFQNQDFTLFHVPGHCPGSIGFYLPASNCLFGGDVLFAGSIGRSDFPNCSQEELLHSIRTKFMTLPDATVVYPGHGSPTTIGQERRTNPFLE